MKYLALMTCILLFGCQPIPVVQPTNPVTEYDPCCAEHTVPLGFGASYAYEGQILKAGTQGILGISIIGTLSRNVKNGFILAYEAPPFIRIDFDENPIVTNAYSRATIKASADAPAGDYVVTLTASNPALPTFVSRVDITVTR